MSAEIALALAGVAAACWAWLHGYRRGVEAFRRRAVESLYSSAELRRALSTDEQILRSADVLDMAAGRIALLPDREVR